MSNKYPSNLFNGEELLSQMRERFQAWAAAGYPGCDSILRGVLPTLNSNPNVVTVFGCQGHFSCEPECDDTQSNRFYLMFVTNERGIDQMFTMHSELLRVCEGLEDRCGVELAFGHSGDIFKMDNESTYPSIILDCLLDDAEHRSRFFSNLMTAAIQCGHFVHIQDEAHHVQ